MVRYAGESISDIRHDVPSGPGALWSSQTTTWFHDGDAAQSGAISNYGQSWMATSVDGPGVIRFYWKVSSQANGDWLEFFLDGVRQDRISGSSDWLGCSYTVTGAGTHTLKWRYIKNGYGTAGSDCGWVDYVQSPMPSDWNSISYVYDPGGRRIEKKYDGQAVMKYVYDGDHIIAEYDATGALVHKYIYGPGVDQPICMIDVSDANATYYYHFDGLGSVIALTDSTGAVANLYEYSIFGEASASDPNHPNRFLFTGREFDSETGLYYYRARYYNPYIGRFLQTDSVGYGGGMNLYRYCSNNPMNWIDPFGLYATDACDVGDVLGYYGSDSIWRRYSDTPQSGDSHADDSGLPDAPDPGDPEDSDDGDAGADVAPSEDIKEPNPEGFWEEAGYYAEGFAEGLKDGVDIAFFHDTTNAGRYGDAGAASNAVGWVSEGASIASGVGAAVKAVVKAVGRRGAKRALARAAATGICFAGWTQVLTAAGLVPIEMIRAGDMVIAYDEASGQTGEFRVVSTFEHMTDSLVLVMIDDQTIEATDEHPFWVSGEGWVPACELKLGMNLISLGGQAIPVTNISFVQEQVPVYNMEIEDAHTYCVSRKCVLVHNACFRGRAARNAEKRLIKSVAREKGLTSDYQREMFQRAIEDYKIGEQTLSKGQLERIAEGVAAETRPR